MSNQENSQTGTRFLRRKKFVRGDLQLKIILGTLFVSLMILFFNFQIPLVGLWAYNQSSAVDGSLPSHMNRLILVSFFISVLLTVPLAVWMGVLFSFQFCGPIYAIKKFFVDLKDGVWTSRCRLREKDDLKDVRDIINECMDMLRARMFAQKEVLDDVAALLREAKFEVVDPSRVAAALERITAEKAEFDRRFPADPSTAPVTAGDDSSGAPNSPEVGEPASEVSSASEEPVKVETTA